MSQPVIEVCRATVRFGPVVAVNDVSLTVQSGEVYGLLGPNGAGKTTLMRAVCGLVPFSAGGARVLDRDTTRDREETRSAIGYMSQQWALYRDLTARENLAYYAGIHGLAPTAARERQAELIALTGLGEHLGKLARNLSGGWKQRLALACALMHRPRLLFLDEPTAGIDPVARRELWDLFFTLAADGVTLVVSTHYMDEAERCTHVGYMRDGVLLASGTPDDLRQLPSVTPAGTRPVEVVGGNAATLVARLRTHAAVREATCFGQAVHALVDAACPDESLAVNGAVVRPIEPSLEDVFVRLVKAREEAPPAPLGAASGPLASLPPGGQAGCLSPRHRFAPTRFAAVARKEAVHLLRDRAGLAMALLFPLAQLFLLSYTYNLQVRNVRTAVLDQCGTQESHDFVRRLENTESFRVVQRLTRDEDLHRVIVAGEVRVAVKIPEDYARRLQAGQQAQVLVLVDGSDGRIAAEAIGVSSSVGDLVSLDRLVPKKDPPVECRPQVLFNPNSLSTFFVLPGLLVILCQGLAMSKSADAILGKKNHGTLETLRLTPVSALELVAGKLVVYLALAFGEFGLILVLMRVVFGVAVHGPLAALCVLMLAFLLATLGYGLFVSSVTSTSSTAFLLVNFTLMPTMFLSGLLLPLDSMPPFLIWVAHCLPTTWLIDAARGVILRGAGWSELRWHTVVLVGLAAGMTFVSVRACHKQLRYGAARSSAKRPSPQQ
jgi:ABC-type multidrug transport system ATPase subunit/ABC-type multidrug transport system permease subunit